MANPTGGCNAHRRCHSSPAGHHTLTPSPAIARRASHKPEGCNATRRWRHSTPALPTDHHHLATSPSSRQHHHHLRRERPVEQRQCLVSPGRATPLSPDQAQTSRDAPPCPTSRAPSPVAWCRSPSACTCHTRRIVSLLASRPPRSSQARVAAIARVHHACRAISSRPLAGAHRAPRLSRPSAPMLPRPCKRDRRRTSPLASDDEGGEI